MNIIAKKNLSIKYYNNTAAICLRAALKIPIYFTGKMATPINHDQKKKIAIKSIFSFVMLLTSSLISGCASGVTDQGVGTVLGGGLGGVLGSQVGQGNGRTAAIIGGTLLGALAGGSVGAHMDQQDRALASQTLGNVPNGSSASWSNPNTGANYQVTPTQTFYNNNQVCREFTTSVNIGGQRQQSYGQACRQADGSWQIN